jgi:hypothetical protein
MENITTTQYNLQNPELDLSFKKLDKNAMEKFEAPRSLSQVIEKTKEEIYAEARLLDEIAPQKAMPSVSDYPIPFAE